MLKIMKHLAGIYYFRYYQEYRTICFFRCENKHNSYGPNMTGNSDKNNNTPQRQTEFEKNNAEDLKYIDLYLNGNASDMQAAATFFYRKYRKNIYYFLISSRIPGPDAEDVLHDVFMKMLKSLQSFKRGNFRSYLMTIARHKMIDFWRARKDTEEVDEEHLPSEATSFAIESSELDLCIRQALQKFAVDYNECAQSLTLIILNDFKSEEIGQVLGRTAKATREYLSQCRKKLKPFVQHCYELTAS